MCSLFTGRTDVDPLYVTRYLLLPSLVIRLTLKFYGDAIDASVPKCCPAKARISGSAHTKCLDNQEPFLSPLFLRASDFCMPCLLTYTDLHLSYPSPGQPRRQIVLRVSTIVFAKKFFSCPMFQHANNPALSTRSTHHITPLVRLDERRGDLRHDCVAETA